MSIAPGVWNFTLPDTSPMFHYTPYSDGIGLTNGWQAGYTVSGFLTSPGESGSGDPFHMTSLPSASVQLDFFGAGISLAGSANCSYSVILDSAQRSIGTPPFGTLFSATGLDNSSHNITLVAQPTQNNETLTFQGATISSPASGNPTILRVDNSNETAISYSGNWTTLNDSKVPNTTDPSPAHLTKDGDASATFNFTGRAIEIRGVTNWGWWTYLITLDGKIINPTRNASSWWIVPDTVLFFHDGLDETVPHSVKIDNAGNTGMEMALNTFTVYQFNVSADASANSTTASGSPSQGSSGSLSDGAIAGIVIGSVAGVGAAALALFMLRRLHRQNCGIQVMEPLEPVLDSSSNNHSPYTSKLMAMNYSRPDLGGAIAVPSMKPSASFVPSIPFAGGYPQSDGGNHLMFGASIFSPLERASAEGQFGSSMPQTVDGLNATQQIGARNLPSPLSSGALPRDRKDSSRVTQGPEGQIDNAHSESESRSIAPDDSVQEDHIVNALADKIVARLGADAGTMRPPPGYE